MTRGERLQVVMDHVATELGWLCVSADETYCPDCRDEHGAGEVRTDG